MVASGKWLGTPEPIGRIFSLSLTTNTYYCRNYGGSSDVGSRLGEVVTGGTADPTGAELFRQGRWSNYPNIPGPIYAELNQKFSIVATK